MKEVVNMAHAYYEDHAADLSNSDKLVNYPLWHGFGFEPRLSHALDCTYPNTTILYSGIMPSQILPVMNELAPEWMADDVPIELVVVDIDSHDFQIVEQMV